VRFGLRSEVAGRSKAGADVSAESICNHSSVVRVEAMLLSTCERGKMGQLECVKEGPDRGLTRYVRCLGTAPPSDAETLRPSMTSQRDGLLESTIPRPIRSEMLPMPPPALMRTRSVRPKTGNDLNDDLLWIVP